MRSIMKSSMKIKLRYIWAIVCFACIAIVGAVAMEQAAVKDYGGYPQPATGYVTDVADLLSDTQETQLEDWLYDCEKEKGIEIAVVTIRAIADYPGTANGSVKTFATGLFGTYGIGNMPKNDGVLLLVSVNDREARIELGDGYPRSRDADAERIMQNVIVPQFRNGRFDGGILNGVNSIIKTFAGIDATVGQIMPPQASAVPVKKEVQTTPVSAPAPVARNTTNSHSSPRPVQPVRPVQHIRHGQNSAWVPGVILIGLVVVGAMIVFAMMRSRGFSSGSHGGYDNSIGQNGYGVVPDDGFGAGFLNGLFRGGSRFGHRGLHNGGIHFGGMSSRRNRSGFGSSLHNHSSGFGSRRSSSNFGGGFGGGHSGGSHHSSFGGGFSGGGGASGKW